MGLREVAKLGRGRAIQAQDGPGTMAEAAAAASSFPPVPESPT